MSSFKLRPHHGLCMEFFRGEGYSEDFTRNMKEVITLLDSADPEITLTAGADIICAACPNNISGECITAEKVLGYDKGVLALCGFEEGQRVRCSAFRSAVKEKIIKSGRLKEVCKGCKWLYICTEINFEKIDFQKQDIQMQEARKSVRKEG